MRQGREITGVKTLSEMYRRSIHNALVVPKRASALNKMNSTEKEVRMQQKAILKNYI